MSVSAETWCWGCIPGSAPLKAAERGVDQIKERGKTRKIGRKETNRSTELISQGEQQHMVNTRGSCDTDLPWNERTWGGGDCVWNVKQPWYSGLSEKQSGYGMY